MSMILLTSKGRQTPTPPIPVGPPAIGDFYQGGYYFGKIVINGVSYYLVKAPNAVCTSLAFKTAGTTDNLGTSLNDGLSNTNALVAAGGYPAASYCDNLSSGGFSDWYLPSRDEVELMYRNYKPTTDSNDTTTRTGVVGGGANGLNNNSEPAGAAYTTTVPARTSIPLFIDPTGDERISAFGSSIWTSTNSQIGASSVAITSVVSTGLQTSQAKTTVSAVIPVRRIPVPADDVTVPGSVLQGGYYVGMIKVGSDVYKLIVAPVSARTNTLAFKTDTTTDAGANSLSDGLANSDSINNASHPAAQYCRAYTGGGYTDWYLGSADEVELYYRNLKNSSTSNQVGARVAGRPGNNGENANSIPVGLAYTTTNPSVVNNTLFISPTGPQAAANGSYWTSTQALDVVTSALTQSLQNGGQSRTQKNAPSGTAYTQPFRRIKVDLPPE